MPPAKSRNRGSVAGAGLSMLWVVLWSGSGVAGDPPASFAIVYEVDPGLSGCPSEREFRGEIRGRLGYDPFGGASLRIAARVHPSPKGLQGELEWTNARRGTLEGTRQLSNVAHDCRQLVRDMAFVLAIQIPFLVDHPAAESGAATLAPRAAGPTLADAGAPNGDVGPARAGETNVTPSGSAVRNSASKRAVAPTSARLRPPDALPEELNEAPSKTGGDPPILGNAPLRMEALGVGFNAPVGLMPSWSAGGEIVGSAQWGRLSLELSLEADLPVTLRQSDGSGFSTFTYSGALAPCGHLEPFALCGLAVVGVAQIEGVGVDHSEASANAIARIGLRAGFKQPVSDRLALAIHADGLFTLIPHTVFVNEFPVWSTPLFGSAIGADLEIVFR